MGSLVVLALYPAMYSHRASGLVWSTRSLEQPSDFSCVFWRDSDSISGLVVVCSRSSALRWWTWSLPPADLTAATLITRSAEASTREKVPRVLQVLWSPSQDAPEWITGSRLTFLPHPGGSSGQPVADHLPSEASGPAAVAQWLRLAPAVWPGRPPGLHTDRNRAVMEGLLLSRSPLLLHHGCNEHVETA